MMPVAGFSGGAYDHLLVGLHGVPERHMGGIVALVYRAHRAGQLDEGQVHRLHEVAQCRQDVFAARRRCHEHRRLLAPALPSRPREQRLVDARNKRRKWGSSGALPDELRCSFTQGENAVAAVIREEVRKNGYCAIGYRALADSAGLEGITVVKRFIKRAEEMNLIKVERRPVKGARNLPNVITITSARWLQWNALGERIGGMKVSPIQNQGPRLLSFNLKPSKAATVLKAQDGLWRGRAPARAAPG